MLRILAGRPHLRSQLLRRLRVDVRAFYRDLELLRGYRIEVTLTAGKYILRGSLDEALGLLPFPDPRLSLGDALQLARGRKAVHQYLRYLIRKVTGGKPTA